MDKSIDSLDGWIDRKKEKNMDGTIDWHIIIIYLFVRAVHVQVYKRRKEK